MPTYEELLDLLYQHAEAWDGEEDSVKEEHEVLILATEDMLARVKRGLG